RDRPEKRWKRPLADEHGGGDDRRPQALLVAYGGLGDVLGADDLVREPVDLFFFVPALVGIEFEAPRGREPFGGELLGVVAGDVLALAEAVMLRQIAVQLFVAGDGHADGRRDQPVRLARGSLGHDDESDLPGLEALHALRARQDAAFGRKNAGY